MPNNAPHPCVGVIEFASKTVGDAQVRALYANFIAEIKSMYVAPPFRGHGLARRLLASWRRLPPAEAAPRSASTPPTT